MATRTPVDSPVEADPPHAISPTARRPPGFRFSAVDAVVLIVAAAATWLTWGVLGSMTMVLPVVLIHFFLFCNVFRIPRSSELVWAAAFIVNLLAWQSAGAFSWRNVLVAQAPLTLSLIVAEMRGGRYHGVGARWINPQAAGDAAVGAATGGERS